MTAINERNPTARGGSVHPHAEIQVPITCAGTIDAHRFAELDASGEAVTAVIGSTRVAGVNADEIQRINGDLMALGIHLSVVMADDALVPGRSCKVGYDSRALMFVDESLAGGTIKTTGNGLAFTNQPANDAIEVVSDDAGDTSVVTLIGTTTGTDTVVVQNVTLNGLTAVASAKTDWGQLLAVKKSPTTGTITVREASADQTITTLTPAATAKGVETVAAGSQQAYNVAPTLVCSGAGTKQIGLQGTDSTGAVIYDSQALNGATAVTANSAFKRVTEVYTGDLENNRTTTIAVGAKEDDNKKVAKIIGAAAASGDVAAILMY